MANTNSTIFEISTGAGNALTSFPFPTAKSGTIETVGKDVIGTDTFFQGILYNSEIVLSGTVDAINSVSLGFISGGPNPTGTFQLCGAVFAAIDLPTMAIDITAAINASATNNQFLAYSSGNSVFIYPVVPTNVASFVVVVDMASTSTMVAQTNPFVAASNLLEPQLKGQQWIWDPINNEVNKVDFVRDNVSAHLKDAFAIDITAGTQIYTIDENHWHSIEFLNIGTASGYIDGVEIPQGVSVGFNKGNQDGFGTFNMIDPKVIDASTVGCKFLVTVY
jgi:hypothetical protein